MTGRPVAEVEQLRAACLAAVAELLAAGPDRIVLVGGGAGTDARRGQPLSIVVGRQLLREAGCRLPVEELVVAAAALPAELPGRRPRARPGRAGPPREPGRTDSGCW